MGTFSVKNGLQKGEGFDLGGTGSPLKNSLENPPLLMFVKLAFFWSFCSDALCKHE